MQIIYEGFITGKQAAIGIHIGCLFVEIAGADIRITSDGIAFFVFSEYERHLSVYFEPRYAIDDVDPCILHHFG